MGSVVDLTGRRFHHLEVLSRVGAGRQGNVLWRCRCDCGREIDAEGWRLRNGKRRFCDYRNHKPRGGITGFHRLTYRSWLHMRGRVLCRTDEHYPNYGARGITVCERWDSFEVFLSDMGPRPSRLHSIERRDVNGHYEPTNCYWATDVVQRRNTTRTQYVEIEGVRRKLVEVCEERGVRYAVAYGRLKAGWPVILALSTPVRERRAA